MTPLYYLYVLLFYKKIILPFANDFIFKYLIICNDIVQIIIIYCLIILFF